MATLDPRGMVGRIYEGDCLHSYTQNINALGLMVSEKKIYYVFPIVNLWELMGRGQIGPQGHDWQNLCRVSLNIATY